MIIILLLLAKSIIFMLQVMGITQEDFLRQKNPTSFVSEEKKSGRMCVARTTVNHTTLNSTVVEITLR